LIGHQLMISFLRHDLIHLCWEQYPFTSKSVTILAPFLLVPLGFVLIALYPPIALLTIFGGYALTGMGGWVWKRMRRSHRQAQASGDARE